MRLLIDATSIEDIHCGYTTYGQETIKSLLRVLPSTFTIEFLIQKKLPKDHELRLLISEFRFYEIDIPVVGLKRLFFKESKLPFSISSFDLYHCLHSNPLRFNWRRSLCTLHDLSPLFAPHYFNKLAFLKKLYFKIDYSLSLKSCDHVVCVSQSTADDLHKFLAYPWKTSVIYEGGGELSKGAGHERQGFYLCIGTRPHKNLDVVYRAVEVLLRQGEQVQVKVVGSRNDYTESLARQFTKEVNDCFIFTGRLSDEELEEMYQDARCLLFMSHYEGFGLPILEAMNHNLPVICSDAASLPEVIGDAGLICSTTDHKKLAESMVAIQDESLYEDLVNKMKQQREKFSWSKAANELIELYKNLIE